MTYLESLHNEHFLREIRYNILEKERNFVKEKKL
jgi:hypothetical protein